MTLGGLRPVDPARRSATSATTRPTRSRAGPASTCRAKPNGRSRRAPALLDDAFGVVWQWTRSAYSPYPGYRAADGALGEYNGKFMVNQMVLRGSSLATPAGHARVELSQFLLSAGALAVQRPAAGRLRLNGGEPCHDAALARARASRRADAIRETTRSSPRDVLAGLTAPPKRLPPKYFYDVPARELFERITALPEYYPTRTELAILRDNAADDRRAHSRRARR